VIPVRTVFQGLCYKLKLSNPLPLNSVTLNPEYFSFYVSSFSQGIDKLEKINLMIAANNTWQGIVENNWPYSQGREISKKKIQSQKS
jgi:hypothetical protein